MEFSNFTEKAKIEINNENNNIEKYEELKKDSLEKFNILKNKIIVTADEIFQNYSASIEEKEKEILLKVEGDFVAQSEFGEYKNQASTAITENSQVIQLNSNNIEKANNNLEEYKSENNADLNVRATAIISQVENNFTKKSEHQEFVENISSQITQTSQNITDNFKSSISVLENDVSTLGGTVSELIYSLDAYIRRGELESGIFGIEIGKSDSNIKARITNDKLSFMQGGIEIAYISGNNLYILRAEILDYLKIGNTNNGYFIFDVTDNGLEVKWSYGD